MLITGRRARVLITGRIRGRPVGGRRQGATRHRRRRRVLVTGRRRRVEGRRLGARRHRRRRRVSRSRLCQLRRALCTRDCSHGAAVSKNEEADERDMCIRVVDTNAPEVPQTVSVVIVEPQV